VSVLSQPNTARARLTATPSSPRDPHRASRGSFARRTSHGHACARFFDAKAQRRKAEVSARFARFVHAAHFARRTSHGALRTAHVRSIEPPRRQGRQGLFNAIALQARTSDRPRASSGRRAARSSPVDRHPMILGDLGALAVQTSGTRRARAKWPCERTARSANKIFFASLRLCDQNIGHTSRPCEVAVRATAREARRKPWRPWRLGGSNVRHTSRPCEVAVRATRAKRVAKPWRPWP
jgi:hypothetical protein